MKTPIFDFLKNYNDNSNQKRFHMPGHKGKAFLGCEGFDITEIKNADALYEADGIIAESEDNASRLFGTAKTFYSTEGSSHCIRSMLYLSYICGNNTKSNVVVAGRNAHKAFIYAAAALDIDPLWIMPEEGNLYSAEIVPSSLEKALSSLSAPPLGVYITSPGYLGDMSDISAIANICHRYNTVLMVDNAHGAYTHFLQKPLHPIDAGADICCDSAHKTLPVLTGGAYLHISEKLPQIWTSSAKSALALFGSTSPSYLTLASLDICNKYLSDNYKIKLEKTIEEINNLKYKLKRFGWIIPDTDPLKLTIFSSASGVNGIKLSEYLRRCNIECEFSDRDFLVCMFTPENKKDEFDALAKALLSFELNINDIHLHLPPHMSAPIKAYTPREAILRKQHIVRVSEAKDLICGSPSVSCPPAIPIAISGEIITDNVINLLQYHGVNEIKVVE